MTAVKLRMGMMSAVWTAAGPAAATETTTGAGVAADAVAAGEAAALPGATTATVAATVTKAARRATMVVMSVDAPVLVKVVVAGLARDALVTVAVMTTSLRRMKVMTVTVAIASPSSSRAPRTNALANGTPLSQGTPRGAKADVRRCMSTGFVEIRYCHLCNLLRRTGE